MNFAEEGINKEPIVVHLMGNIKSNLINSKVNGGRTKRTSVELICFED